MTAAETSQSTSDWVQMEDPPARAFLEAVELGLTMALRTVDPVPGYRSVVVRPWRVSEARCRFEPTFEKFDAPVPSLWAYVQSGDGGNHDFLLAELREWAVLGEDLTERRLRGKRRLELDALPRRWAEPLRAADAGLRAAWSRAARRPDFDAAAFLALDERLAGLASRVAGFEAALAAADAEPGRATTEVREAADGVAGERAAAARLRDLERRLRPVSVAICRAAEEAAAEVAARSRVEVSGAAAVGEEAVIADAACTVLMSALGGDLVAARVNAGYLMTLLPEPPPSSGLR